MNYVLAAVATILASESVFHLPFGPTLTASISAAKKSMAVIQSPNISDHWKERVILKYASQIFIESLRITLMCSVVVGVVGLVGIAGYLFEQDLFHFFMTWEGVGVVTAVSIGYIITRKRLV